MWTCSLLKENARSALAGRYWRSFWLCFVLTLLGGGGPVVYRNSWDEMYDTLESLPTTVLVLLLAAALLVMLLSFLWYALFLSPLSVGSCRYFMENRHSPAPAPAFRTTFGIFQAPYLNVVKVQLLVYLKILGGMFLLLIPGIYWSYCYTLVPYLLAENPYLSTGRAMALSQQMMEGEKFHYFVLQLSFLGWDLLCALTFGLGFYFLAPYKSATSAEFYAAMRTKALIRGYTSSQELGGFVRHEYHA